MKLTKSEKKYIKEHYKNQTVLEMAEYLGAEPEVVTYHLKKLGKSIGTIENALDENLQSFSDILVFIKSNLTWVLLAIFLTFFVYFNSLGGDFISDDIPAFKENPLIRNFGALFSDPGAVNIQKIFYVVSYNLFGMSPIPIHLMSVVLHVLVVVCVMIFVSMLFNKRVGVISALLFAVHPVNTEAVSWMSGAFYIMTALATLAILITYLIYLKTTARKYYLAAIFIYMGYFLMNRHPWTIVISPIIFALDLYVLRFTNLKKRVLGWMPYALMVVFIVFTMSRTIGDRLNFMQTAVISPSESSPAFITSVTYTISESAKLYMWPFSLTFYHEGDSVNYLSFIITAILLGLFIITLFKSPRAAFLIGVYIISISLCLSPIRVAWYLAERYMYLGTFAFCTLLGLFLCYLDLKTPYKRISIFLTVFILVIYSVKTISRNIEWQNQDNLWIATAKVSPYSSKAHLNLADVYFRRGDYQKSIDENKLAEALSPNYAAAIHNLGIDYLALNQLDLAEASFIRTIQIDPSIASSYFRLGYIETQRGNTARAIEYFKKTLEVDPTYTPASNALKMLGSQ